MPIWSPPQAAPPPPPQFQGGFPVAPQPAPADPFNQVAATAAPGPQPAPQYVPQPAPQYAAPPAYAPPPAAAQPQQVELRQGMLFNDGVSDCVILSVKAPDEEHPYGAVRFARFNWSTDGYVGVDQLTGAELIH